jgi:nitrite reductase/ring-hydroxylating ferredoxin subunit
MKKYVTKGKGSSNYNLCLKSKIAEGCSKVFSISHNDGKKQNIAVFNWRVFSMEYPMCAHEGDPLNQGTLEKAIVSCP